MLWLYRSPFGTANTIRDQDDHTLLLGCTEEAHAVIANYDGGQDAVKVDTCVSNTAIMIAYIPTNSKVCVVTSSVD